jgi:hypothetical protein
VPVSSAAARQAHLTALIRQAGFLILAIRQT